ncbi:Lactate utilization protein B/C [Desulfotomaculum nigrificans CO-1-SRB]|uniref:Lactate utilization protein B/C n=1 Tax=Desulfotomaculum nigrificans (strain DSM 14880 / VKM B-2319 / CO-1-SRB) TaxID=868595 RepID=F6B3C9_DESCC|nr:LUD domain-containing protein [Desulfotomaculum nigrificans]AEF95160.1 Lactate utilization protein B/C [Desulfotomaculum nigrificans CO-1-SRB]
MAIAKLKQDINSALNNDNLTGALGRFGEAYLPAREKAYEGKDFAAIREQIKEIKSYAADHMEELAEQFAKQAEKNGAKVFRAKTAAEAKEYIAKVVKEHNAKTVIKSKSMASEEIHLNDYLLKNTGVDEVAETDLGEWIIQLCGQRPSHMVMPAIHMTRDEVAEIFSKETNQNLDPDIAKLVKVARENLRQKFLRAGIGISGANIAVAETGTIVMCTNEGNGRLTTTVPPVHIILVGLEKLVPKFKDVGPILEALPRSATGQKITSYVTMISGPTPAIDLDGNIIEQKELHIVLMDNGRTAMRDDPMFKQALQCIRCASCLNVCPVFQKVGGHVYGHVYTGGIGTILTAFLNSFEKAGELQNLCLRCERCKTYCPGKIDLPALIAELRRRTVEKNGLPMGQKLILEKVLTNRKLFHSLLRTASVAQKPFVKGNVIRHLPLFFSGLTEGRSLPAIAAKPLRDKVGHYVPKSKPKAKVGYYAGCLGDFVYPEQGEAAYKVLGKMGMEIVFPLEQTCCGIPATQMGAPEVAVKLAKQNIEAFEKEGLDYIVSLCPTCVEVLKHHYVDYLKNDPAWKERAEKFAAKVVDFPTFVAKHGKDLKFKKLFTKATYHDSCHMKRTLNVWKEPRELLNKAGVKLVEMKGCDECCGFGGSYSIKMPEISKAILDKKLVNAEAAGADVLALDCPGCKMQIAGGLDAKGSKLPVKHTVELLAEALDD